MNCAFDKEKLSGYYDGELDAAEKAEVERHIASCSECLRELGELKSAAILVKELPRLRAPRSVAEGVRKEIQVAGRVHSFARARRTVMWAASAAAALFIGINLIYFSSRSGTPAPDVAARATSIESELGRPIDRGLLLVECLAALQARYGELQSNAHTVVIGRWRDRAVSTFGRRVEWDVAGVTRHGVAEDIDDTGALLVRDGTTRARVISGEVRWLA